MFNSRRNASTPGIVREQRKRVPYTITTIGGANEHKAWKLQQVAKEEAWQTNEAHRVANVVKAMEDGSILQSKANQANYKSATTNIYERKARIEADTKARLEAMFLERANKSAVTHKIAPIKESWFNRMFNKLSNFFMNIKF